MELLTLSSATFRQTGEVRNSFIIHVRREFACPVLEWGAMGDRGGSAYECNEFGKNEFGAFNCWT